MKTTEHLQLNQWDPEDRILRQDFNADNARVDALAGQVLPTLIREVVTTTEADSVELDLSDIDWSQWRLVLIDALPITVSGSLSVQMNWLWKDTLNVAGYAQSQGIDAEEDVGTSRLTLLCNREPQRRVVTVSHYTDLTTANPSCTFRELTSLICRRSSSAASPVAAGSVFRILGVK